MEKDEKYQEAKKRVEDLKGFYTHLVIYIIVNLGLFLFNILQTPDTLWFYWPLVGWGIGVVIHGASVLINYGLFGKDWEEKKIQEYLNKDKK